MYILYFFAIFCTIMYIDSVIFMVTEIKLHPYSTPETEKRDKQAMYKRSILIVLMALLWALIIML